MESNRNVSVSARRVDGRREELKRLADRLKASAGPKGTVNPKIPYYHY